MIAVSEDLGLVLTNLNRASREWRSSATGLDERAFTDYNFHDLASSTSDASKSIRKGLDLLLEASAGSRTISINPVVIAGDGPDDTTLKDLALSLGHRR